MVRRRSKRERQLGWFLIALSFLIGLLLYALRGTDLPAVIWGMLWSLFGISMLLGPILARQSVAETLGEAQFNIIEGPDDFAHLVAHEWDSKNPDRIGPDENDLPIDASIILVPPSPDEIAIKWHLLLQVVLTIGAMLVGAVFIVVGISMAVDQRMAWYVPSLVIALGCAFNLGAIVMIVDAWRNPVQIRLTNSSVEFGRRRQARAVPYHLIRALQVERRMKDGHTFKALLVLKAANQSGGLDLYKINVHRLDHKPAQIALLVAQRARHAQQTT